MTPIYVVMELSIFNRLILSAPSRRMAYAAKDSLSVMEHGTGLSICVLEIMHLDYLTCEHFIPFAYDILPIVYTPS
jgi:hypothetical protein